MGDFVEGYAAERLYVYTSIGGGVGRLWDGRAIDKVGILVSFVVRGVR